MLRQWGSPSSAQAAVEAHFAWREVADRMSPGQQQLASRWVFGVLAGSRQAPVPVEVQGGLLVLLLGCACLAARVPDPVASTAAVLVSDELPGEFWDVVAVASGLLADPASPAG